MSDKNQIPADAPEPDEIGPGWVPFDEQRQHADFRRADIVFGPDMFDPRTENGDRPLTEAMRQGRSAINPNDLSKTVGEVYGPEYKPGEIRKILLDNARSIGTEPN